MQFWKPSRLQLVLSQQVIEPLHLAKAIIETDEKLVGLFSPKWVQIQEKYPWIGNSNQKFTNCEIWCCWRKTIPFQWLQSDLIHAKNLIDEMGDEYISLEIMLLALLKWMTRLRKYSSPIKFTAEGVKQAIVELRKGKKVSDTSGDEQFNALNKYAVNLNLAAESGKLDPIVGRDEEIRRILHILSRRKKNNPILIGKPV